jgi:tRNA A37 threonylcarbamoyladenosine modification protein TsaB
MLCGSGLAKLSSEQKSRCAIAADFRLSAADVARVALQQLRRNRTVDPMALVPRYLRQSAAQEKAKTLP